MNILVTGGAGYLGSILVPKLLARGHRVKVLDIGYFGVGHLRALRPAVELIREDIRRIESNAPFLADLLDGCNCVIHLAAISNDPSAELNPDLTDCVNTRATQVLAAAARQRSIRLLFSSSCSVYGTTTQEVDEEGSLNPLTAYAASKMKAEQALRLLADSRWAPVILRNGTLFGCSPRMRFDLVVNILSLYSTLYNEIRIFGDGHSWRPFLHVADCARAFLFFAEKEDLHYGCYNVAYENLRVIDLAEIFKRLNPQLKATHLTTTDPDPRDYRVSTVRMKEEGFEVRIGVKQGAEEMTEAIVSGLIPDPESIYYRNAKWLKELAQIGSKDPREVLRLMETWTQLHGSSR